MDLTRKATARRALIFMLAPCALAGLAETLFHPHAPYEIAGFPLFHALFGFTAFLLVVLGGVLIRPLLTRPPDYYGKGDPPPPGGGSAP